MRHSETIALPSASPGTTRSLQVHRYGQPGGAKAYLQAGLHGDELPGLLVMEHLLALLDRAAAREAIRGEIVCVPLANPIGFGQHLLGRHAGRFDLATLGNFNRLYPSLSAPLIAALGDRLGDDAAANIALIRAAARDHLAQIEARGESDALRLALMRLAVDADIVLDLHCDDISVLHLYLGTPLWPGAADLAAELGARAVLLAEASGGEPFDEAVGGPWWALAKAYPERPIPPACLAATVELRGDRDVSDALAAADAAALFRFLVRRGLIAGETPPLPDLRCAATPLDGADIIECPVGGVLVFAHAVGERVAAGDMIAEIVDPMAPPGTPRIALSSRTDGLFFARPGQPLARPGLPAAKIAGAVSLAHRTGPLLTL